MHVGYLVAMSQMTLEGRRMTTSGWQPNKPRHDVRVTMNWSVHKCQALILINERTHDRQAVRPKLVQWIQNLTYLLHRVPK